MATIYNVSDLPARLIKKIDIDEHGCWLWNAGLDQDGYAFTYDGNGRANGRNLHGHRFVYQLLVGPIPTGLQLDHTCHNDSGCPGGTCRHRRCVNPDHLEPVTGRVNRLRSPNTENSKRSAMTHCMRARHQRWGVKADGMRYCRECSRLDMAARRAAKKAAAFGVVVLALAAVSLAGRTPAGAQDWFLPAEATSILTPAYVPAVGPDGAVRGDSIHAICGPDGTIEVAVHPYDEVARNLQVWSADGRLLVNVTSADHAELVAIADQPATLRYSGGAPYQLATQLCSTVPLPSSSVPTTSTSSDTSTTVGAVAAGPVEPLRTAPGPEAATTTTAASVLASSARAELPATGSDLKLAGIGFMLAAGGVLTVGLSRLRSRAGTERSGRP